LWAAGWLSYHHADYAQTARAGREILRTAPDEDSGNRRNGLTLISIAALATEDTDEAIDAARAALELAEASGVDWLIATSLLNLGTALRASGDAGTAVPLLLQACSKYLELGDRHFLARTLIELAHCDLVEGREISARTHIKDALGITRSLGDLWSTAEGLEAAATLCAERVPETAMIIAAAARRIRNQIAMQPHPPDERLNRDYMEKARLQLDAAVLERAQRRGAAMTVEEALRTAAQVVDALLSGD
ncbi:MAG TPA: tetratricopeptide repeat protein, partial [Candidatus Dormibacteraeota bacterium]|nr:tetratricopeptide repeat protein [Candidatus Dormibacteraeota bacterium]